MKPNNVANAIFAAFMLLVLFQVAFSSEWAGSAQCSDYFSCTSCTAQDGCGWCAYLTECMPGTVNGSNSGWCTDFWSFWMYQPSECPAVGPIPSKCTSMPCSECVASTYCGWCGSSCVPGTVNGPYYGSCPSWYFSACPVVLAKTVWWLWAMFGFLLFSLLVTAFGICFFKRCRALINGTPVSGEHTPPVYQTKLYMTGESSAAQSDAEHALLEDE